MNAERRRLIAAALASPPVAPDRCALRDFTLAGQCVRIRVPPRDFITHSRIRRAHNVALRSCGAASGAVYHELLQAEFSRISDAEPWYWDQLWPGGIALARFVQEEPTSVRGQTVLEFGTGLGLLAVSAAVAGATLVVASDIDATALAFAAQSAADNGVGPVATDLWDWHVAPSTSSVVSRNAPFDVVMLPDVMYDLDAVERLGALAPTLVKPGGVLLFADGTDRPYGASHTERLIELLSSPPALFAVRSSIEQRAGADTIDGGAAPDRPVRLVVLERNLAAPTMPVKMADADGPEAADDRVQVDVSGLVQREDSQWTFCSNTDR